MCLIAFGSVIAMLASASLQAKKGLPLFCQVSGWLLLCRLFLDKEQHCIRLMKSCLSNVFAITTLPHQIGARPRGASHFADLLLRTGLHNPHHFLRNPFLPRFLVLTSLLAVR